MAEKLEFAKGGVPTKVAAEVFGKSEMWVREMIYNGMLPIGLAMREDGKKKMNVYIVEPGSLPAPEYAVGNVLQYTINNTLVDLPDPIAAVEPTAPTDGN